MSEVDRRTERDERGREHYQWWTYLYLLYLQTGASKWGEMGLTNLGPSEGEGRGDFKIQE